MKIENTNLVLTGIVGQVVRNGLLGEFPCETVTLIAVRDFVTGQTGHILHHSVAMKVDFTEESFFTETPELFEGQHPDADTITCYTTETTAETPRAFTPEMQAIVAACEHEMEGGLEADGSCPLYLI